MEFHQIRYFLVAAETLNFTRAAERCNVTQPALTRAVKKLEEELGGLLFRRNGHSTHLTDLGRLMQEHLGRIDATSRDALIAARKLLCLEIAPLNLGIMCTIGAGRTAPFLAEFQMLHPGVQLSIHDITPQDMTDGLLSGDLDCALLGLPMPLPDRFDSRLLYEERMAVIFPPDHRFNAVAAVSLDDIGDERYLDRLNCEFREVFLDLLKERNIELSVPYRSEREDWIQNMVLAGMGISIVPEQSIVLNGLQSRPLAEPSVSRRVELVTVAGYRHSAAMQAFVRETAKYPWGALGKNVIL